MIRNFKKWIRFRHNGRFKIFQASSLEKHVMHFHSILILYASNMFQEKKNGVVCPKKLKTTADNLNSLEN